MKSIKLKNCIYVLFVLFLLFDIGYSCIQFYGFSLDGDVAESVLPIPSMEKTMQDPLGIKTILEKDYHHNPNRFFSHWIYHHFFREIPLLLQNFTNPINSVYATCALAKILMHLSLLLLLCWCTIGSVKIKGKNFTLVAVLLTPLFQTYGYKESIGLIIGAISYTFFYALACIFLIIYFLPLIFEFFHGRKPNLHPLIKLLFIPFAFVVCFTGSLNPGIALIVSLMMVVQNVWTTYFKTISGSFFQRFKQSVCAISKNYFFYLIPISFASLYSLYVGSYNSAQFWEIVPLHERYARLPLGFFNILTNNPGFLFIAIILTVNILLIKLKYQSPKGKKIINAFKWIGIFSLLYILLLPLGGYRLARPNIIRIDTFMPVVLGIFFLIGTSTFYILKEISNRNKIWYYPLLVTLGIIFTIADKLNANANECEKKNLITIANSKEDIVRLPNNCPTITWGEIHKINGSHFLSELLYVWKITDKPKRYYNNYLEDENPSPNE